MKERTQLIDAREDGDRLKNLGYIHLDFNFISFNIAQFLNGICINTSLQFVRF